ncbi:hypothetical protein [Mycolicibacter heraklionensis]|uniref:hypothetical protein n=1 Tax=Mycolicibacter heraklionensis TaxID=512402 RepID=UPI0007EA1C25|nr:hypothetical protein [Mycolicibacter heraklionensis]OBG40153.1 hypothetical protein A5671_15090 [Mycolicibacter heraklionensis]
MLVIALVLAVIGLAALVFAVVTSNALVAWVCIGASVLGVLLLIVDALRERRANAPAVEAPLDAADAVEESEVSADDDAVDVESSDAAEVADFDAEAAEATEEAAEEPANHSAD